MNGEDKVKEYLSVGGLFNPECMEHEKVRDLMIELQSEIKGLRGIVSGLTCTCMGFGRCQICKAKKQMEKINEKQC